MSGSLVRASFIFVLSLGFASLAGAQSLGTFKWQLQPYCNVLTLTVTQTGGSYSLDGFDDQCGAGTRASAAGVAFPNPDGTIGLGIAIVATPSGAPVHVDATISLATLSGTWRDSQFQSGTFAFGASSAGNARPYFSHGLTGWSIDGPAKLFGVRLNGTREAPLPVTAGQTLAEIGGAAQLPQGYPAGTAHVSFDAAEDWNGQGAGSKIGFWTAANGTNFGVARMTITHDGKVGIGTLGPADRLDVSGDIRVGTTLFNGCVKNNGGNAIAGACSSDARYKRDVTPFAPALAAIAQLRPVHYYWRAAEFPKKGFGDAQAYGLIAQDVAAVLPELVSTDADGYQVVDYAKLPLLAIQAIGELKAKNDRLAVLADQLQQQNDLLARRLAAIEGAVGRLSVERDPR